METKVKEQNEKTQGNQIGDKGGVKEQNKKAFGSGRKFLI